MRKLLSITLAFGLAYLAQRCLVKGGHPNDALVLYALGAVLFIHGTPQPRGESEQTVEESLPKRSLFLMGGALLCGMIAFLLFRRDISSPPGLVLWLISVPFFLAAMWPLGAFSFTSHRKAPYGQPTSRFFKTSPIGNRGSEKKRRNRWLEFGLLAVIVLLSLFLRTYRLDTIPNGCQSDECNNGLDALRWLSGAPYTPYAETNEGQATLFTYGLALFFRLFGVSVPTMRLLSALCGVGTVIAFYFLARYLFGIRVGSVGTALLAFSRWHITFSRIVYEAILVPLCEILTFYFLLRGLREGRRRHYALAGIALGLGLNTYTAFRLVTFTVAVFCLYWLITHRRSLRHYLGGLLIFVTGSALTIVPLAVYIIQHWGIFLGRIRHISIRGDIEAAGGLMPLWGNLRKYLLMFNYRGDPASLNNLPGAPLLDSVVAPLFILGLAYALYHWRRPVYFMFLAWFVTVLQAGVLSVVHEAPSARRTIGLIPIIYLLVCSAINGVWTVFQRAFRGRGEKYLVTALGTVATVVFYVNYNAYFNIQAKQPSVWMAHSAREAAVGEHIASLGERYGVYLAPAFNGHSAIRLIAREPEYTPLNVSQHLPLREDADGDVVYILDPVSRRLKSVFRQYYPNGLWEEHRDPFGQLLFLTYTVTAAEVAGVRGLNGRYYPNESWQEPASFERRDALLPFDWRDGDLSSPFSVEWRGSLFVSRYGRYLFGLQADGVATLTLDGQTVVESRRGYAEGYRTLVGGFHALVVRYSAKDHASQMRLLWSGPGLERVVVPSEVLYALPAPTNGLTGYYFQNPNWWGPPALIQMDNFILPNDPLPVPFSIEWRGRIEISRSGHYIFGTHSDDGSYVYIDGQLVVDNGGSHGARYRQGEVDLERGSHDIVVRYFQAEGSREMELWWIPPNGVKELVPQEILYPAGVSPSEPITSPEETPPPPILRNH